VNEKRPGLCPASFFCLYDFHWQWPAFLAATT
jgi:hypothetical protein